MEEKSFGPCEDLIYGRMSFQGFNPEVEVGSLPVACRGSLSALDGGDAVLIRS